MANDIVIIKFGLRIICAQILAWSVGFFMGWLVWS